MDHTSNDNDTVKAWYAEAKTLEVNYKLHAYPTFLFFDPTGRAVHRAVGYLEPGQLLKTARNALDPAMQYYTLLNAYNAHQLDYPTMPMLAKEATSFDEEELAEKIAADYIQNYLVKLSDQELLTKDNIDFSADYVQVLSPDDRLFKLCYSEPAKIDSAMNDKEYAEQLVNAIIYNKEIAPELRAAWKNGPEPDWSKISTAIASKFGDSYAEDNIVTAKVNWYKHIKDGKRYAHFLTIKSEKNFDKNGIRSMGDALLNYNAAAFYVFQYDVDNADLRAALKWIDAALNYLGKPNSAVLDTKANLLYKLGDKNDAITLETQAAHLDPNDNEIAEALRKMRAGEPTWATNGMK